MKNTLIIGLLAVIVILIIGFSSKGNSDDNKVVDLRNTDSSSSLEIVENNLDIGDIPIRGGKVNAIFTVANNGTEPLVITGGWTSCMCTEAVIKTSDGKISSRMKMPGHGPAPRIEKVINAGDTAELVATFDPMAHGPNAVGPIRRDIMIQTNSTETPELKFSFEGVVIR